MSSLVERLRTDRTRSQLQLIYRLAQRQVAMRYKESALGALWSVLGPLALLAIYGVVYGVIFEPKWATTGETDQPFALFIFSGIVAFTLFAEITVSATTLIQSNATLIKRTMLSPRVIPIASALGSLFTFAFGAIAFIVMYVVLAGLPPATALLTPLLLVPLWVLCLGFSFIISAISAYFRDLQQVVPLLTTAVLFLSPVFYPETSFPEPLRQLVLGISPLGVILPASKELLFYGTFPDPVPLLVYSVVAVLVLVIGYWGYGKAARGFADVV
jgi:lipopolysaccharide transport system permease protein